MATTSTSLKFCTAARNTMRPMRPKPLMPILMVMEGFSRNEKTSRGERRPNRGHDVLRRESEVLEQYRPRRRLAVAVDADHRGAAVLPPAVGHAHFDRDARH